MMHDRSLKEMREMLAERTKPVTPADLKPGMSGNKPDRIIIDDPLYEVASIVDREQARQRAAHWFTDGLTPARFKESDAHVFVGLDPGPLERVKEIWQDRMRHLEQCEVLLWHVIKAQGSPYHLPETDLQEHPFRELELHIEYSPFDKAYTLTAGRKDEAFKSI